MAEFIEVARVDQIPSGSARASSIADKDVAVFNVDGISARLPIPVLTLAARWE